MDGRSEKGLDLTKKKKIPLPGTYRSVPKGLLQRELGFKQKRGRVSTEFRRAAEDSLVRKDHEEMVCKLPHVSRSTFLMVFSPDGTKVASTHGNHNVYVTDLNSGKNVNTLSGHPRTPWCIAFHPSSNQILASGCLGGQVRVWDLHGGSEIWTADSQTVIASLAFHPTDRMLVIATYNELHFWDWSQPIPFTKCYTANEKEKVRYVAFDPLGHKLITGISNAPHHQSQWDRVANTSRQGSNVPSTSNSVFHGRITVLPEQERRISVCYRSLVEQYEQLVQRYYDLSRSRTTPTMDRGTDPMDLSESSAPGPRSGSSGSQGSSGTQTQTQGGSNRGRGTSIFSPQGSNTSNNNNGESSGNGGGGSGADRSINNNDSSNNSDNTPRPGSSGRTFRNVPSTLLNNLLLRRLFQTSSPRRTDLPDTGNTIQESEERSLESGPQLSPRMELDELYSAINNAIEDLNEQRQTISDNASSDDQEREMLLQGPRIRYLRPSESLPRLIISHRSAFEPAVVRADQHTHSERQQPIPRLTSTENQRRTQDIPSRNLPGDESLSPQGFDTTSDLGVRYGIQLLSRHIDNMQRLCRARLEILQLQQIRRMWEDLQRQIRSLHMAVRESTYALSDTPDLSTSRSRRRLYSRSREDLELRLNSELPPRRNDWRTGEAEGGTSEQGPHIPSVSHMLELARISDIGPSVPTSSANTLTPLIASEQPPSEEEIRRQGTLVQLQAHFALLKKLKTEAEERNRVKKEGESSRTPGFETCRGVVSAEQTTDASSSGNSGFQSSSREPVVSQSAKTVFSKADKDSAGPSQSASAVPESVKNVDIEKKVRFSWERFVKGRQTTLQEFSNQTKGKEKCGEWKILHKQNQTSDKNKSTQMNAPCTSNVLFPATTTTCNSRIFTHNRFTSPIISTIPTSTTTTITSTTSFPFTVPDSSPNNSVSAPQSIETSSSSPLHNVGNWLQFPQSSNSSVVTTSSTGNNTTKTTTTSTTTTSSGSSGCHHHHQRLFRINRRVYLRRPRLLALGSRSRSISRQMSSNSLLGHRNYSSNIIRHHDGRRSLIVPTRRMLLRGVSTASQVDCHDTRQVHGTESSGNTTTTTTNVNSEQTVNDPAVSSFDVSPEMSVSDHSSSPSDESSLPSTNKAGYGTSSQSDSEPGTSNWQEGKNTTSSHESSSHPEQKNDPIENKDIPLTSTQNRKRKADSQADPSDNTATSGPSTSRDVGGSLPQGITEPTTSESLRSMIARLESLVRQQREQRESVRQGLSQERSFARDGRRTNLWGLRERPGWPRGDGNSGSDSDSNPETDRHQSWEFPARDLLATPQNERNSSTTASGSTRSGRFSPVDEDWEWTRETTRLRARQVLSLMVESLTQFFEENGLSSSSSHAVLDEQIYNLYILLQLALELTDLLLAQLVSTRRELEHQWVHRLRSPVALDATTAAEERATGAGQHHSRRGRVRLPSREDERESRRMGQSSTRQTQEHSSSSGFLSLQGLQNYRRLFQRYGRHSSINDSDIPRMNYLSRSNTSCTDFSGRRSPSSGVNRGESTRRLGPRVVNSYSRHGPHTSLSLGSRVCRIGTGRPTTRRLTPEFHHTRDNEIRTPSVIQPGNCRFPSCVRFGGLRGPSYGGVRVPVTYGNTGSTPTRFSYSSREDNQAPVTEDSTSTYFSPVTPHNRMEVDPVPTLSAQDDTHQQDQQQNEQPSQQQWDQQNQQSSLQQQTDQSISQQQDQDEQQTTSQQQQQPPNNQQDGFTVPLVRVNDVLIADTSILNQPQPRQRPQSPPPLPCHHLTNPFILRPPQQQQQQQQRQQQQQQNQQARPTVPIFRHLAGSPLTDSWSYPGHLWRSGFRPRFLHPRYMAPTFIASEEPEEPLENVRGNFIRESFIIADAPMSPNHRIQAWDFSKLNIPDISNAEKNVVVAECKIHNDASVDVSSDGRLLVTLLPTGRLSSTAMLGVYSLEWDSLGQCLYTTSFEQNAVSVSLSPTSRHLLVGLASRRVALLSTDRQTMAQIFRLEGAVPGRVMGGRGRLCHIRDIEQEREQGYISLNCIRWAPGPGQGLVFGTNTGKLKVLR